MRIKRELKNNITYLSLVEDVYNPEKKRGESRKIKDLGVEEPAKPLNEMTEQLCGLRIEH
jgi:dTDP-4-dehydrorhamnose 3,5-epimerase-like enzyme